jgi:AraC family transcriptional regulator of adaptative response/methylated-DNA-[protein]-cysteine methyltransferase
MYDATQLRVAFGDSSLGLVLVAWSGAGVAAVLLGDDRDALRGELRRRFRRAAIVDAEDGGDAIVDRVVAQVESPASGGGDIPLDLRGTAFQREVWRALREIPAGATATYAQIADRIGSPAAIRAVAGACAANAHAVLVPCHRAIRSDGTLAGYRWGVERKQMLIDREAGR